MIIYHTPHSFSNLELNSSQSRLAYGVLDAAKQLGISRSKVYDLIGSGELQDIKVGSRTLITHQALIRFLQVKESGGQP